MLKKIVLGIIILLSCLAIFNLIRQTTDALSAGNLLDTSTEELLELQAKNTYLKQRYEEIQSVDFIEEQAREKLNLSRQGETIVVLPQSELDRLIKTYQPLPPAPIPHWQGWLRLFFN